MAQITHNPELAGTIVNRARSQIGTAFRLHGRVPDVALDCIGLAAFALFGKEILKQLPIRYRIRGDYARWLSQYMQDRGLKEMEQGQAIASGDLIWTIPGPAQLHLYIATHNSLIHAHAGLGRVVESPLCELPATYRVWRLHHITS